jgi:lysophospholipase L1-like esterase
MVRRVAFAVKVAVAGIGLLVSTGSLSAEPTQQSAAHAVIAAVPTLLPAAAADAAAPPPLSFECRVKCPIFDGRAPLRTVRKAIRSKKPIRVLAIGSSSTTGIGASSPLASYPVRLENDLEGLLKGFDFQVISRGVNGEVAENASERMKLEVAELKPDLVVWQVGTNDAMARVGLSAFATELQNTLKWLADNKIDVVLIDPQYVERLSQDAEYKGIVETIAKVAAEKRVLLVNRFDAMADLAKQKGNTAYLARDQFHLNDLGYRCMAEYAARAIVAGILQAESEPQPKN